MSLAFESHPDAWASWPDSEREPPVRSKGVTGFQYRGIYFVQDSRLTIVAVAHSKRRPGYWRERMSEGRHAWQQSHRRPATTNADHHVRAGQRPLPSMTTNTR